jgi:hypothetical protein
LNLNKKQKRKKNPKQPKRYAHKHKLNTYTRVYVDNMAKLGFSEFREHFVSLVNSDDDVDSENNSTVGEEIGSPLAKAPAIQLQDAVAAQPIVVTHASALELTPTNAQDSSVIESDHESVDNDYESDSSIDELERSLEAIPLPPDMTDTAVTAPGPAAANRETDTDASTGADIDTGVGTGNGVAAGSNIDVSTDVIATTELRRVVSPGFPGVDRLWAQQSKGAAATSKQSSTKQVQPILKSSMEPDIPSSIVPGSVTSPLSLPAPAASNSEPTPTKDELKVRAVPSPSKTTRIPTDHAPSGYSKALNDLVDAVDSAFERIGEYPDAPSTPSLESAAETARLWKLVPDLIEKLAGDATSNRGTLLRLTRLQEGYRRAKITRKILVATEAGVWMEALFYTEKMERISKLLDAQSDDIDAASASAIDVDSEFVSQTRDIMEAVDLSPVTSPMIGSTDEEDHGIADE